MQFLSFFIQNEKIKLHFPQQQKQTNQALVIVWLITLTRWNNNVHHIFFHKLKENFFLFQRYRKDIKYTY